METIKKVMGKKSKETSEVVDEVPLAASSADDLDERSSKSRKSSRKERSSTSAGEMSRSVSDAHMSSHSSHKSKKDKPRMIKRDAADQSKLLKKMDDLMDLLKAQQTAPVAALAKESKREKPEASSAPSTSAVSLANVISQPVDESTQFNRDVRRAFQTTTSLLMLAILLIIGYYVYLMIEDYIAPFFWAVLFSIILRKPKALLKRLSEPLSYIERQGGGFVAVAKNKIAYLWKDVFAKPLAVLCGLAVVSYILCFVLDWGCWIPWVWLIVALTVVLAVLSLILSATSSSSLDSLSTTILVVGCLVISVLFIVLFVFKGFTETGTFFWKIQAIVEEKVHDPIWAETLTEYGITSEAIAEHIETGQAYLDDWVTQQGYNMTEITETITSMTAAAEETEAAAADAVAEVESGMFDFIYDIDTDKAMEYYHTATEAVDMEVVGEYASSIGSAVFDGGAGIAAAFGSIIASLLEAVDAVLQFIVFIGALMFFLESDESFLELLVRIVPVSRDQQKDLADTIQQNVIQVFVSSMLICFAHGAATWLYFSILGLDFAYSAAAITGLMALFPLTSPWLVYAPALLTAYVQGDGYVLYYAVGLFVLEFAVGSFIDPQIHDMIPNSSEYLTGIGLALGVATFGYQGVLIGPMLIVCLKTAFEMFCSNVAEPTQ